jgi:hypothetical protein
MTDEDIVAVDSSDERDIDFFAERLRRFVPNLVKLLHGRLQNLGQRLTAERSAQRLDILFVKFIGFRQDQRSLVG